MLTETLWRTPDGNRHFIIPDAAARRAGALVLRAGVGDDVSVDPDWAARFEVGEAEARAWAQAEFGFVLDQLRHRVDARLAAARSAIDRTRHAPASPGGAISPDAVPATMALLRALPRAILDSLSADPARIVQASGALQSVERRLGAAGVDVAPRLGQFAFRLAGLRRGYDAARRKES